MQVLILSARPYQFPNEKTGEMLEGVTVVYADVLAPIEEREQGTAGTPVMKVTAPWALREAFGQAPAVYECEFRMRPGKDNKPTLSLSRASFSHSVDFEKSNKSTAKVAPQGA